MIAGKLACLLAQRQRFIFHCVKTVDELAERRELIALEPLAGLECLHGHARSYVCSAER